MTHTSQNSSGADTDYDCRAMGIGGVAQTCQPKEEQRNGVRLAAATFAMLPPVRMMCIASGRSAPWCYAPQSFYCRY